MRIKNLFKEVPFLKEGFFVLWFMCLAFAIICGFISFCIFLGNVLLLGSLR
jgi:hypothetical protein